MIKLLFLSWCRYLRTEHELSSPISHRFCNVTAINASKGCYIYFPLLGFCQIANSFNLYSCILLIIKVMIGFVIIDFQHRRKGVLKGPGRSSFQAAFLPEWRHAIPGERWQLQVRLVCRCNTAPRQNAGSHLGLMLRLSWCPAAPAGWWAILSTVSHRLPASHPGLMHRLQAQTANRAHQYVPLTGQTTLCSHFSSVGKMKALCRYLNNW